MMTRRALRALGALGALNTLSALGLIAACDDDVVSPARGTLQVTISGLPTGQTAAVTVTGPGSFSQTLPATTSIGGLEPGSYTIAAANVESADSRWSPTRSPPAPA
jgi:hypothetical protein